MGFVVVLVVLALLAVVWFVAMLSGGLDDLFDMHTPSPDDAAVIEAHAAAGERTAAALDELRTAAGDPAVLASASDADCREGQHNWKIDDPYDLTCSRHDVVLVPGGTLDAFRDEMVALDAALLAAGWEPSWSSMSEVLSGYWDNREGILANNPGWTYPARIPDALYLREGLTLAVSWVQPGSDSAGGLEYRDDVRWTTPDGDSLRVSEVPALVTGDYGTALAVSVTYFEE